MIQEQQLRKAIATIVLNRTIPQLKAEVMRYTEEAFDKQVMAIEVSTIVGKPIAVEIGELKMAAPFNELIDLIVLYVQKSEQDSAK